MYIQQKDQCRHNIAFPLGSHYIFFFEECKDMDGIVTRRRNLFSVFFDLLFRISFLFNFTMCCGVLRIVLPAIRQWTKL